MNRYHISAFILAICGLVLMGYSVASGEGSASVVLFIPVFHGSGLLAFLGVLCIMVAMFLVFFGFAAQAGGPEDYEDRQAPQQTKPKVKKTIKGGGVVLIGPIPIIFGSDAKTTAILIILALVLIITVALLFYI